MVQCSRLVNTLGEYSSFPPVTMLITHLFTLNMVLRTNHQRIGTLVYSLCSFCGIRMTLQSIFHILRHIASTQMKVIGDSHASWSYEGYLRHVMMIMTGPWWRMIVRV